ncbi:hypothetical protein [Robbsia andropogonis]|uniref:hypothetical protein n=1 Tax=Robbsia andropogonis TaxID=28092 RepID=UPI00209D6161|nr:hypothetical protein [Robbsia andropogonis]MCP1117026.1 hypothetical protein [Robbsia andropogonis]MCP1128373.1 hypothetical protein [Robbsia andropogonis]
MYASSNKFSGPSLNNAPFDLNLNIGNSEEFSDIDNISADALSENAMSEKLSQALKSLEKYPKNPSSTSNNVEELLKEKDIKKSKKLLTKMTFEDKRKLNKIIVEELERNEGIAETHEVYEKFLVLFEIKARPGFVTPLLDRPITNYSFYSVIAEEKELDQNGRWRAYGTLHAAFGNEGASGHLTDMEEFMPDVSKPDITFDTRIRYYAKAFKQVVTAVKDAAQSRQKGYVSLQGRTNPYTVLAEGRARCVLRNTNNDTYGILFFSRAIKRKQQKDRETTRHYHVSTLYALNAEKALKNLKEIKQELISDNSVTENDPSNVDKTIRGEWDLAGTLSQLEDIDRFINELKNKTTSAATGLENPEMSQDDVSERYGLEQGIEKFRALIKENEGLTWLTYDNFNKISKSFGKEKIILPLEVKFTSKQNKEIIAIVKIYRSKSARTKVMDKKIDAFYKDILARAKFPPKER